VNSYILIDDAGPQAPSAIRISPPFSSDTTRGLSALGREGIREVAKQHKKDLASYANKLTHIATTGLDARYDQITLIKADTLEEIYNAAVDFRMGAKAKFIEVVDVIVGIEAQSGIKKGRSAKTG
jgi:hypothetical protein